MLSWYYWPCSRCKKKNSAFYSAKSDVFLQVTGWANKLMCCDIATFVCLFVCVLGDETAQVGTADCKLSAVSGALQRPNHTSRTEPEGEWPRSLPPDCPKCSRKVGDVVHSHTHICAYSKVDNVSWTINSACEWLFRSKIVFLSAKELYMHTNMLLRKSNEETERGCKRMMIAFKDN